MSIMKSIVFDLRAMKDGYCQLTHKRAWLNYLAHGQLAFDPTDLRGKIEQIVKRDAPKGDKLFCLEKHVNFTMTAKKVPYRTEEALERFIVNTNRDDDFFNQISIGGRKESIDIGIRGKGNRFTFVELKPWVSTNSPMYAIVECLKNLTQYREILKDKNRNIDHFKRVDIMVLAPLSYYRKYELVDDEDNLRYGIAETISSLLGTIGSAFETAVSLMALEIDKEIFDRTCVQIYQARRLTGQGEVKLEATDTIPSLKRDRWRLIATSGNR